MITGRAEYKGVEYTYSIDLSKEDIKTFYINKLFKEACEEKYPELLNEIKERVEEAVSHIQD